MNRGDAVRRRPGRPRPGGRLLPATLALVALFALIGLGASSHRLTGAHSPDATFLRRELTVVVVAMLVLAVLGVVLIARTPRTRTGRRAGAASGIVGVALVVAALWLLRAIFDPPHRGKAAATRPAGTPEPATPQPVRASHPVPAHLDLIVVALIAAVLLLLVVAAVRSARADRYVGGPDEDPEAAAPLAQAIDEVLLDLRAEPDARRAVIAAYARMETLMRGAGFPRRGWETPSEYLGRVLVEAGATAASVDRLTPLYERAKFSLHEIDATMKADAIAALEDLRDDLTVPA